MTAPLSDHTLKIADLLDRPGASRQVRLGMPVPRDFDLPLVAVGEPVVLDGVVESVVDGLLVRGRLEAALGLTCSRCTRPVREQVAADVVELFMDPADVDGDDDDAIEPGYEIRDGHLDLAALLRDTLSTVIPYQPLCRPDCRGLCAMCGTDLNDGDCDCGDTDIDPRWEALRRLRPRDDRP